ncbi:ESPR-type extended signal peptide-containing protein [Acinetobacter courvalinii]|uniref:ESPR-type extended signal peptide-containing protein n=1 Tax=Acinetobacter courvalinii TaxID=280147 RepID=UPI0021D2061B|nr:ESPR-type extended signal peptide-containing protein [Acinetobacter courvalinii]MCU4369628.1 YadA-like family protein [Acinetobacter courvalinii]MCU4447833.1 YadA-like family protein [Acinetobacter courvalinii]
MNKIYRLVWNKSLQLWTVVSEIARGVTKNRNVTARPGTALSSTAVPSTETHFSFSPTLLLTMICSVMWSGASFAAAGYEAAGGTTYTNCTATSRGSGNRSNASIAIGENACAQGNDTIAMGGGATTQSRDGTVHAQSIAIGKDAQATGDQSIALGANTRAVGDSSVAIGGDDINRLAQDATLSKTYTDITGGKLEYGKYPNTTAQHGATAVGVQAVATGDFASAYGMTSKATGDASAAFGVMSNAAGKGAIAFGAVAQATGDGAAALGINATASGLNSTAIGSGNLTSTSARALAESATAIGSKSLASATETTAIGRDSQATAKAATAVGYNTQATGENSFASGNTSQATGLSASAVGSNTLASGEGSFAGGSRSSARGLASTALGAAANALTDESLALGARATASGEAAIAVGNLTTASGNHALSVGGQSLAEGEQSVSMGYQVKALGNNSTAVGSEAHATETESVALGYKVQALASNTLAAGSQSIADKNGASAMGHLSEAKGEFATAAGAQAWALADRTTALGYYSRASGEDDIAIGSRVVAEGKKSIAIGAESNALAEQDIAIGSNATTAKSNGRNISIGAGTVTGDTGQNVAMGSGSTTANSASSTGGAVAIGRDQKATGDGAVALGDPNTANGNGTVALGRNNTAAGDAAGNTAANGAVAIGNENQAIGQGSVALGNTTTAAAAGAIAMGDTANAQANRSVALGTRSTADSNEAVAIGSGSEATGTDTTQQQGLANRRGAGANPYPSGEAAYTGRATAVGQNNKVTNTGGGTAVGNSNTIDGGGFHNIAIGQGNSTTGDGYNAALGVGNEITSGNSSTAIGVNNRTAGNTAIALGRGTNVLADFGIGQGNTATVEEGATGGISLGNSATTSGIRGIAIGSSTGGAQYDLATAANASGVDSIALGTSAKGTGNQAIAVGRRAKGTGNNAAAYGNEADANGTSSVAVGDKAKAQGDNDIAIGLNAATATGGSNNIAMGNGVTTGATGQNVAMGSGSTTANAASSEGGAVAIGRDQKATGDGAVALGDPNTANGNGTVALGRNNTAAGDTAGNTAANGAVAIGNENQAIGQGSVALGNASTAAEAGSIALGDTANAQAANGVALGSNAVATNADDVALGSGSETSTATGTGYRTGTAAPSSVVSVGTAGNERRIQNLSDGSADTDAVNVRQLRSVQDGVDQLGQSTADALGGGSSYDPTTGAVSNPTYNINGTDTNNVGDALAELDKGWTLQSNGANAGAVKAGDTVDIGTADGEENLQVAKDGNNIKYSLNRDLKVDSVTAGDTVINNDGMTITGGPSVTKDGIDAAGTKVTNVADGTDASDAVNKGQLDQASQDLTDKGFGLRAQDGSTVQKKLGEAVDVVGADPNISTKVENGQVAIELSRNLDVDSVTAGDTVMNTDGVTIANGPNMTKSGIDAAGNKVTNVADGDINPDSTDAINGSQLYNTAQSTADALGGGSTVNPDGTVSNPTYNINGTDTNNVGDALAELDKGWTLQSNGANAGAVKAGDTVDIGTADGEENLQVAKDGNNIKYSLNRDLKVNSVTAGDTVINNDGMSITGGPSVTKDGIDAAGTKVTNVADGTDATDAVNKGQLDQASQDLTDKGFGLRAQDGSTVHKKLGEAVDVVGADPNISTKVENGQVAIELSRNLDVDSVTAGDTVMNTDGVTIANGPSMTKSGIDAAGNKVTNVADGDINPDSTDAINGSQLYNTAQSTADALGGGSTVNPDGTVSNPTYNINGTNTNNVGDALAELDKGWTLQSNDANAGAVKAGDTVDIGTADGEENLQVAKDGNNIKYSLNRDLKVDSVTAGDTVINNDGMTITGGPSVTKDGIDAAGTKVTNVADGTDATDAVNKGQLDQASQDLTDKGFGLRAQDGTTVQKKLGEAVDVVGADPNISTKVENGQVEIELSRNLDIDSVTAGDTVMNTDGVTIANGPSMTKSGIDAAGNKVTNVAAGTEGTDAVNVDQLKTSTAASRTEVEAGKNITVDSSTGADGQTIYTVATADDVEFNSVKVGDVNIDGATGKISGVTDGTVAADSTEAINGSQLHNTAQSTADALGGGSTVNPDGTVSNPTYNINGTDTNNVGDALAELDKGWTLQSNGANSGAVKAGDTVDIGTADGEENLQVAKEGNDIKYSLNRDLNVDSVTAGNTRLDNTGVEVKDPVGNSTSMVAGGTIVQDAQGNSTAQTAAGTTTKNAQGDTTLLNSTGLAFTDANGQPVGPSVSRTGIDAGDLKITNVAPGTVSADSKDAINGSQLHAQGEGVKNIIGGNTQYDPNTGTYTNPDIGGTGQNNINDAIGSISDAATKAKTTVTQGENIVVTESKNSDGSSNYEVATAKDVNFDSVNVGDVNIDGATGKISGVAAGDVNPDSTDAVNGSQLANNAQSVADALGGGSTVNPDGTVSAPNYNVNGTSLNNVGDAITELDKGWNLQSNGANSGAVKAGDAVDIGTADGEENLQVAKEGNDIKYSLNRDLKVDSVTAGDSVINNDGMTITGGPSITKAGINAGNNKITGVAPGTVSADSTDAINGSQLHAQGEGVKNIIGGNTQYDPNTGTYTNPDIGGTGQNNINDAIGSIGKAAAAAKTEVDAGKNMTVDSTTGADGQTIYTVATADDVEFNSVKVGDVNIDGTTGKISGVAAGDVNPDSTDAVNGSQLANNAQSVADALGGGSTVNPDGTVSAPNYNVNGTSLNNVGDAITELDKGWTLQSNGANSGAVKAGDTVDIGTADEEENLQVAKEGNTIKYSLSRDLNVDSVTAGDTLINTDGMIISGGPSVTKAGINAGNKKITGVALGTVSADSTEAINGSQLHAQGEGVKNIIGGNTQYDPNTGKYTNPDIGGTGKDNINDAIGAVGDAAKAAKSTVSNKDGNITVNETTKADGSRDYEVGLAKDIKVDSVTAGGTKVDGDGLHIDGGPSVTKEGIDAGDKKVTGVADGTVAKDSKDAVNGGQLHAQGEGVKDIIGGNTTYDPNTGKYTNTDIGGTGENNINDAIQSVKNDAKAAKTSVSNTDNNLTINKTTKTDGSTDYEVGLADKIKVKQVDADQVNVAGDQGKTSISGGGISITGPKGEQGPSMTTAGINAGGKKVTGVADGAIAKDSQDAVNGSQLHQSYQDVGAALGGGAGYDPAKGWTGPSYEVGGAKHDNVGDALGALDNADKALGDRITNLGDQMQQAFYDTNQRIDDVKKHANAGVAAAMALETAPYISGKYTYAVGAAYHGGENAVGVTLRKTADNGRWSLTTGVAAASQGDPSFRVGLSGVFD